MRSLWHILKALPGAQSDDDLLRAFVRDRSEAAFAGLVDRHGGLVLGVCRRILGHAQDAEDAYQATFLVLARKAQSLRGTGPLGPWLFGVARRVALKALTRRPRAVASLDAAVAAELLADEETSMDLADVRPILDAEVARLPRPYRHALILCQLEGQSKAEAARQLGCPEGTVSSRLMRAKELLRARLVKRGVSLGALAALETLLAPPAASAALAQATVQAAVQVGSGAALAAAVSPSVLSLTQGVTQAMFLTKVKLLAAGLIVIAGMSLGAGYVAGGGQEKGDGPGAAATAGGPGQGAKPKNDKAKPEPAKAVEGDGSLPLEAEALRRVLAKPTNQYDARFGESFPLADHLDHLEKAFGVTTQIDVTAYQEIDPVRKLEDLLNIQVAIPKMRGEPVGAVLEKLLEGIRFGEQPIPSTYMIRRRTLVIVPKEFVKRAAERMDVALEAKNEGMTLADALEKLATDTGVSIILDPRVEEMARATQVRTSIRNVRLISAVRLLANMADLSVMNVDGALYVTEPRNVTKLQAELDGGLPPEGFDKPVPAVGEGGKPMTPAGGAPPQKAPSGKSVGVK